MSNGNMQAPAQAVEGRQHRAAAPGGRTGKRRQVSSSQAQTPAAYRSLCTVGAPGGIPPAGGGA